MLRPFLLSLLLLAAGCATNSAPPPRGARSAASAAPESVRTASIRVYARDESPACPHQVVAEISERSGVLGASEELRLLRLLRAKAVQLRGHAIVDLKQELEGDELLMSGTVIRFTREGCVE